MGVDFEDFLEAEVFDRRGDLAGNLECFWTDNDDQAQFLGIKLKSWPQRTCLVPVVLGTADERQSCVKIDALAKDIASAPSLDCDEEPEESLERRVYAHFRLSSAARHELHRNRPRSD
jgi:hypothetical protein